MANRCGERHEPCGTLAPIILLLDRVSPIVEISIAYEEFDDIDELALDNYGN